MLAKIVDILIAFALGYGVRELISRFRRKKKSQQNRWIRLEPNELVLFRANPGATRKHRKKVTKAAVNSPEAPEHAGDLSTTDENNQFEGSQK